MSPPVVCFSHGQESGPWGTKIRALAEVARGRGFGVESLDYQGMADPLARVELLVAWCARQAAPPVLVGSSMGGFVALSAATRVQAAGLFLLAPALYVDGYRQILPAVVPACPVTLVHGFGDDLVPWEDSVRYAAAHRLRLVLLDGDHRLTGNLPEIGALFGVFLDEMGPAGPGGA